jgi:hypothetical protein
MLKLFSAVAAGFAIWLTANVVFSFISIYVWGDDPDSYLSIALQCWGASAATFAFSVAAKERIVPAASDRGYCIALAAVVLPWAASASLNGVDVGFKLWGLAGHGLAAGLAIFIAKPAGGTAASR